MVSPSMIKLTRLVVRVLALFRSETEKFLTTLEAPQATRIY